MGCFLRLADREGGNDRRDLPPEARGPVQRGLRAHTEDLYETKLVMFSISNPDEGSPGSFDLYHSLFRLLSLSTRVSTLVNLGQLWT